jgi:pimeloyl-ACP methyl ester carboxylesterase
MATIVLVHGSHVGGWCWRWATPELRAAGHEVYAPTLTGHGERVHLASPEVDLDTHIEDVVNLLRFEDLTDVVLLGWSYGGMIAAGVADRSPERIAHVVYLDADVPRDGDTSSLPSRFARREELARAFDGYRVPPAIDVDARPRGGPLIAWPELPRETRAWVVARFTPQILRTWTDPIRLTGAGASLPTTYIRCTVGYDPTDEDTMRQDARVRSEPTWRYRELLADHFVPLTNPRLLAEVLCEIA